MEEATTSKLIARADDARHLAILWARVVKAEVKADHLEAEPAYTSEDRRSSGTVEKPLKGTRGYDFGFRMCELIM